jgi:hypothetical protein
MAPPVGARVGSADPEKRMDPSQRAAIGKIVDRAGQLFFWAGLGSIVGYWASDRGMPWLPTFVGGVLLLGILSLLAILVGRALMGKAQDSKTRAVRWRILVAVLLAVAAAGARLSVFWMAEPSPLTRLSREDLHEAFKEDTLHYAELDRGMDDAVRYLHTLDVLPEDRALVLSSEGEAELLDLWATLYANAFAQDSIRIFYEDWYRFDPSRAQRASHVRAFLLTYAAELSVYERTARFATTVLEHKSAVKFLDTPHPSHGLGEGTFSMLRQDIHGSRDQARIVAGAQYLEFLEEGLAIDPEELGVGDLWNDVEEKLASVERLGLVDRATLQVRADLQGMKRTVRHVWYPAQSNVASFLGDVRVRRIGWYLIDETQQEAIDAALQPGDILLGRKNWYISNVGLPGFWPHAILYVGEPVKLMAAFDTDPAVLQWVETQAGHPTTYSAWLEEEFPREWEDYRTGHEGHPNRVIEAISEGVVTNSFPHVTGDTLGGLRPKLPPLAKAQAIAYAFAQIGKPYDFDFDFATEHAIVCSELVWRAYRPGEGKEGFDVPLVALGGRQTLPANEIAKWYDTDAGTKALDFVLFYDADERNRVSIPRDAAAFRGSWKRSRWEIVVGEATL